MFAQVVDEIDFVVRCSLGSLDWPHRPTLVFSTHFVLTRAHPGRTSRSITHPQVAPSQAHLTSKFFSNEVPEKKLQLIDMSILSILLSPEPGSHRPSQNYAQKVGFKLFGHAKCYKQTILVREPSIAICLPFNGF